MMSLMARLCALCALSAVIQMALGESDAKGSLRMIGGLLMLYLTLSGARDLLASLSEAASVEAILKCLMQKRRGRGVADWIRRLKAALTPQLVLLLLAALALIGYCTLRDQTADETTRLEKQASAVLSRMEGAGRVEVTIMTRKTQMGNSGLLSGKTDEAAEIPCGAVAVAQGADDPLVRIQLEQALCALLGLPGTAVSVMAGGK